LRLKTMFVAGTLVSIASSAALVTVPSRAGDAARAPFCLGSRATMVGTARADTISGTARRDVIVGRGGADLIHGRGGRDLICAGAGDDVVRAGAGADRVDGGAGFDVCVAAETRRGCEDTRNVPTAGSLRPGDYITAFFRPRFAFTLGAGWTYREFSRTSLLDFTRTADAAPAGVLIFSSLDARQPVATVVGQILSRPLTLRSRSSATLGGAPGERIDAVAAAETELFSIGSQSFVVDAGEVLRFYVVEARGVTLVVLLAASEANFPAFAALAEELLARIEFR
jgi:Ca2+-binding RTX toxin-like protein